MITNMYLLTDRNGGVDAFIDRVEKDFSRFLDENLSRMAKRNAIGLRRNDSLIAAYSEITAGHDPMRFQTLVGKQNSQEAGNYRLLYYLNRESAEWEGGVSEQWAVICVWPGSFGLTDNPLNLN